MSCDAYYGTGDGWAICKRPAGHPPISVDGIGHAPVPTSGDRSCTSRVRAWDGDQIGVPCQKQVNHEGDHALHNLGLTVAWGQS